MVTDPRLIVVEDSEAFTSALAAGAVAMASVHVRVELWDVDPLGETEVTETSLTRFIECGELAMSARAVAKCRCPSG